MTGPGNTRAGRWAVAIGAGPEQLPWIRRAREMGHPVLALDGDPRAVGRAEADAVATVDLRRSEAVLDAIAASEANDGVGFVLPAPMGRIIATLGEVNAALGLPGIGPDTASRSADKAAGHTALRAVGARRPHQLVVSNDPGSVRGAVEDVGLPCVVKPRDGSGSRGVMALVDRKALDALLPSGSGPDRRREGGEVVVEEMVPGPEVGVDLVVDDGRARPLLVRSKELTPPPARQVLAYSAPAAPVPGLDTELALAVRALGLISGVAHADVVLGPDGPVVIEASARPAGLLIAERLAAVATGIDVVALSIELVIDPAAARRRLGAAPPGPPRGVALRFLEAPPGRVVAAPDAAALRVGPGVVDAQVWARPGGTLAAVSTGGDVYQRGVVVTVGRDAAEAAGRAAAAAAAAPILVDP